MANETSSSPSTKHSRCFNEQVNTLLFIMFLIVVLMLFVKGCKTDTLIEREKSEEVKESTRIGSEVVQRDSITSIIQNAE